MIYEETTGAQLLVLRNGCSFYFLLILNGETSLIASTSKQLHEL